MKKSKIAFIGMVFSVLLTGCMTSSEPYSFPISNVQSKTFIFSKVDSSNVKELSANDVLSAVKSYIRDNGAFYKCQSSSFFRRADATTQMVVLGCQKGGEVKLVVLRASLF